MGSSLARDEGSKIYVFHSWSVLYEKYMQSQEEVERVRHDTKKKHERRIFDLVEKHARGVPKKRINIQRGTPGNLIPKFVKDKEIELLVMGTVGRTGISGLLIGNTAEMTLNKVNCSVLAVKPDGFVSPVKRES
jgi:nucleotide-binding universal stress UspA family protein